MRYSIYILLIFILISCHNKCILNDYKIINTEIENVRLYYLYLEKDLYLYLNENRQVISGICIPNGYIDKDLKIVKCQLNKSKEFEYVFEIGINGSTFGAKKNIIIWSFNSEWQMTSDIFVRAFLYDYNKDGILEFISYYPKKDTFNFYNGGFIPIYYKL